MIKKIGLIILILMSSSFVIGLSPDEATIFVTKTNNFLTDGETPAILSPVVTIEYAKNDYWVITGMSNNNANIYIPINNNTNEIASGALEVRSLIQTTIILNNVYKLKNSFTASDWPFVKTNQTNFETMHSKFGEKIPSITSIETDFSEIKGAEKIVSEAKNVKKLLEKMSKQSNEVRDVIEEGINFEKNFFVKPKTSEKETYEKIFSKYFTTISEYKKDYEELKNSVNTLRNLIGALQTDAINANQKEFYNNIAKLPNETVLLNNVFSRADETQTLIEQIFNSVTNIENFVLNLESRKQRNNAWKLIYGLDNDIKKTNQNINSLEEAAQTILNETHINYWKNQSEVNALKINWKQTQEKYKNGLYQSATEFAKTAKKNSVNILKEGFVEEEETQIEGLLINIIIALICLIIGIFLFEKFYLNKKKEQEFDDEEYDAYRPKY